MAASDAKMDRDDKARERRIAATRLVEQFIHVASQPGCTGNFSISWSTKDGHIGTIKATNELIH